MLYVFEEKPIKNKFFENWTPLSADENCLKSSLKHADSSILNLGPFQTEFVV